MTLYVATTNAGKLRDFAHAANGSVDLQPLPGLQSLAVPREDGLSFAANACAKAIYYSNFAPGKLILADDSGLEVDILKGAPGVRSARYAEDLAFESRPDESVDERNNRCLLDALQEISDRDRFARYRCALAIGKDGIILAEAEGSLRGRILHSPKGSRGFGYDPLFLLPEQELTMAELDDRERMTLSHRGRALTHLLQQWSLTGQIVS